MACVYLHKTTDNKIFYIGIGNSKRRAYTKTDRNPFWHKVVNKYGYKVEILFDDLTRKEASEIETYLIYYYGRRSLKTGNLVNFTDGDTKGVGYKHTKEALIKISRNNAKTKSKKVIDNSTGIVYDSLIDYCRKFNISYSGTKAKLNGQNKNNTNLKYLQ